MMIEEPIYGTMSDVMNKNEFYENLKLTELCGCEPASAAVAVIKPERRV
jgi:hypothetical protein